MNVSELKKAIQGKIAEIEVAIELAKPQTDLKEVYKELKELQYQLALLTSKESNIDAALPPSHFSTTSNK